MIEITIDPDQQIKEFEDGSYVISPTGKAVVVGQYE